MRILLALLLIMSLLPCARAQDTGAPVRVGAKSFTESAILGYMLGSLAEDAGADAEVISFPGSTIAFNALIAGEIDAYPEYTGTLTGELLSTLGLSSIDELRRALADRGIAMSDPLGFNNTYAVGVTQETARLLSLETISDLVDHPDLSLAFSTEFMNRADGWPALAAHYDLPHAARGIDHALAYRALESGQIDATDLYSTDAQIPAMNLAVLEDDRDYFPRYDAVIIYRMDFAESHPDVLASMVRIVGQLDEAEMQRLNQRADIGDGGGRVDPAIVAADAVNDLVGINAVAVVDPLWRRIADRTVEHLRLVLISMGIAVVIAIPLGIWAARSPRAAGVILACVGILQTIPAIALLVLLIGPLGIGARTAIVALLLYSLLPIVRNTHAGLTGIPGDLIESACAIGLSARERLLWVELPLALPTILAGIKIALVINIGTATLGGFISAGGYGQPIFTGITQNNFDLILEGAVPAAVLAVIAQVAVDAVQRAISPHSS